MRNLSKLAKALVPLFLLLWGGAFAGATVVSGTFKYSGTPFTGSMTLTLVYPGSTGSYLNLPIESAPFAINNGTFTSFVIDGNDVMQPSKTYYVASLYDPYGSLVTRLPYYISGSSFDLGAAVPTPVLANNLSFLDILGLRSLSVQQLTILAGGSLTFSPMVLSATGITNALQVNAVLSASAYNVVNPSSTTCGIEEAELALPASGGTILLPSGTCNVTTTIALFKPTRVLGLGSGGWSAANHATTASSTLLSHRVGSAQPMFYIAPTSLTQLTGVSLENFAVQGVFGSTGAAIEVGAINDSARFVSSVLVSHVFASGLVSPGIEVGGNCDHLTVRDTEMWGGVTGGVWMINTFSVGNPAITNTLIEGSTFNSASNYGLKVDSAGVTAVRVVSSHFDANSQGGVYISAASTAAVLLSSFSTYTGSLVGPGVDLEGGYGHTFFGDTITGNFTYGILQNNLVSGPHAATIQGVIWGSNTTKDLHLSNSTTLLYPSATGLPTSDGAGTLQQFTLTPSTPY